MPGLFETASEPRPVAPLIAESRARKRRWLNALLLSLGCHVCPAPAGDGCDHDHDDDELLTQIDRDPPLYAHVPRIARVIAARPTIRRLVLAQFDDGQAPEGLTGDTT
jgi:hypothetical protein